MPVFATNSVQAIYAQRMSMTKITKWLAKIGGFVKRKRIPYGDRCVVITLPVDA